VTIVERTPGLYDWFYRSVWRYHWFAAALMHIVGSWSGRRLAAHVARVRPDLIVSTYPVGNAGMAWLRRHRGLEVPVGAWVSDFSPYPFWVYRDLDLHLVMHDVAVPVAQDSDPGATAIVSAPTVTDAFGPGDRAAARRRLSLPADAFIAVVCGRNEALRDRIERGFAADERVRVLGWVDDMAALMIAANAVVTNAGGVSSLEALACGRAVLMHRPIAGHGKANAALMAAAGLAETCLADGDLARAVERLRREPRRLSAMQRAAAAHTASHNLADGLRALDAVHRHEDTLFAPEERHHKRAS